MIRLALLLLFAACGGELEADAAPPPSRERIEFRRGVPPSRRATAICGNGIIEGAEGCDDGGTTAGDGCSATCTVEAGFSCLGVPSTCIDIGETTVVFNSFETTTPTGDPGGYGVFTAFPAAPWRVSTAGPMFASVAAYQAGTISAVYYRGQGHAVETSSHRVLRSGNGGRSWGQATEEIVAHHDGNFSGNFGPRTVMVTELSTGRWAMVFHTLEFVDQTTQPVRVCYYRYSDDDGATWSTRVNMDQYVAGSARRRDTTLSTWTDETADFNSGTDGDVQLFPTAEVTGDYFVIGATERFNRLDLDSAGGTAGSGGTVAWEYCSANSDINTACDTWTAYSGLVDGTSNFTASAGAGQVVYWTPPGSAWLQSTEDGVLGYHGRARVTGLYTTNPIYSQGTLTRVQATASCYAGARVMERGAAIDVAVSTIDTGEVRRSIKILTAPTADGATWSLRAVAQQDGTPGTGHQFEGPFVDELSDGRWMLLSREDPTGQMWRSYSSDDGATWDTATAMFNTRRIPAWKQVSNGVVVAVASPNTEAGTRIGQLYFSRDLASTWVGPVDYLPANPETATNDQMEADLYEVAPNLLGIISGQERALNGSSRLLYTEVGIRTSAPVAAFRPSYSLFFDSSATTKTVDYGNTAYYNGQTEFTAIGFFRRQSNQGLERIYSKGATSQLHFNWHVDASAQFVAQIASSLSAFATATVTSPVVQNGIAYYYAIRYLGACSPSTDCDTNAERLRIWLCTNPTSCTEATVSYSGTIPAALTSPSSAALTYVGNHPPNTAQFLRDYRLGPTSIWPVAISPTLLTGSVYNQRVPLTHAAAAALIGTNATIYLSFDNTYTDERGLLPAPTVSGPISFSQQWAP